MADNSYTIYINLNSIPQNGAMAEQESGAIGGLSGKSSLSEIDVTNSAKKIVTFATAAATADRIATMAISEVNLRTGANEYEQRMEAAYSMSRPIIGAGAALAMGAITGTLPFVALGLAITGIGKAFSSALNISQKASQLNMSQALEDVSINMQNIRAGVSGRRSGNQ